MTQAGPPAPQAQPHATRELTTPRLRLRGWRPEDAADLAAINLDPEVTRYLNRPTGAAAVEAFFPRVLSHWEEYGFGFWALESLEAELAGTCLGFVGVAYPKFLPELASQPEIGWRLARRAWGRGLATEAALAAREDAFTVLGFEALISIIHPENTRSQRIAQKLGMTLSRHVHNPQMNCDVEVWQTRA
jgi:RimJ/RimL family protein N-acetyltransferase